MAEAYLPLAEVDFFFFLNAFWTLRSGSGYLLENRSPVRRIATELRRLERLKLVSAKLVGYRRGMEIRLSNGAILVARPDWDESDPGWNLRVRNRIFWLRGQEDEKRSVWPK